jgi:hypothetical protein
MNTIFYDNTLEKYKNKIIHIYTKDRLGSELYFVGFSKSTEKIDASLFFREINNNYLKITITSNIINKLLFEHKLSLNIKKTIYLSLHRYFSEIHLIHKIVSFLEGYEIIYE